MLNSSPTSACLEFRKLHRSRREFLRAGGLSAIGLSLPAVLQADQESKTRPKAKAIILLYCFGGPSHLDMWDMKPRGPSAIRGPFSPIATRLPGTVFCEHLPLLSQRNDKFTLVRSMTHDRRVHGGAVGFVLTGTRTNDPGVPGVRGPDASPDDHPAMGAAISRFAPADHNVPAAISLPWPMIDGQGRYVPGQNAGMLGQAHDPWFVHSNPNDENFRVEGLALSPGLSLGRLADRQRLLIQIDDQRRGIARLAEAAPLGDHYQRAFSLLTSRDTRQAFEISSETPALRERYGRNALGQSCLLARRLVQAGVRCVQINASNSLIGDFGWDTHSNNFKHLKDKLLPRFDPAFTALLDDLDERGLLDQTLVVCLGEFGRSPAISKDAGRDHWPQCYSLIMAGGGVRRGFELGESDSQGAFPERDPVRPEDITATIYAALGVDPHTIIRDRLSREHTLVKGRILDELFA